MTCYTGMTADGRLIFSDEFKKVCARYGYVEPAGRGKAFDAAPQDERQRGQWPPPNRALDADRANDEAPDDRAARYQALEAAYAACRSGNPTGMSRNDLDLFHNDETTNMESAAERTRQAGITGTGRPSPQNHERELSRFREARGLDVSDSKAEFYKQLESLYDACRGIVPLILLLIFLPSMRAQSPNLLAVPLFNGIPPVGTTCNGAFPQSNGGPAAWLSLSNGLIYTCRNGVWALYANFDAFQGTGSAVTMNGTDIAIFTFSLPPLSSGSCWSIAYGVGAGLSGGTIYVKIDGTTISTPFVAGSLLGVNVSVAGMAYCNNAGTQSAQTLVYTLGAGGFLNFITPNSGWDYSASGLSERDPSVSTPAAIDWSVPHTLTITANQPSGTVLPSFARISGGN